MGGGHDGHGHELPYKIPDWRKYKVEDCPELKVVQAALERKGLRDPWLRLEMTLQRFHIGNFKTIEHLNVFFFLNVCFTLYGFS